MINFIFGISLCLNIITITSITLYIKFEKKNNKNVEESLNNTTKFFNDFFECNFNKEDFLDDNK